MPDLRLPVGLFFLVAGLILAQEGVRHPQLLPGAPLNADLDWGAVLLVFGAVMTFFGWRAGPEPIPEGNDAPE